MSKALAAILGAIGGAILSGILLEAYKRHRDRQGAASAIAGEIFAILQMSARRNYVPWLQPILPQLDSAIHVPLSDILRQPIQLDPVTSTYRDRLGLPRA